MFLTNLVLFAAITEMVVKLMTACELALQRLELKGFGVFVGSGSGGLVGIVGFLEDRGIIDLVGGLEGDWEIV